MRRPTNISSHALPWLYMVRRSFRAQNDSKLQLGQSHSCVCPCVSPELSNMLLSSPSSSSMTLYFTSTRRPLDNCTCKRPLHDHLTASRSVGHFTITLSLNYYMTTRPFVHFFRSRFDYCASICPEVRLITRSPIDYKSNCLRVYLTIHPLDHYTLIRVIFTSPTMSAPIRIAGQSMFWCSSISCSSDTLTGFRRSDRELPSFRCQSP
jgi:hypothetical protein